MIIDFSVLDDDFGNTNLNFSDQDDDFRDAGVNFSDQDNDFSDVDVNFGNTNISRSFLFAPKSMKSKHKTMH